MSYEWNRKLILATLIVLVFITGSAIFIDFSNDKIDNWQYSVLEKQNKINTLQTSLNGNTIRSLIYYYWEDDDVDCTVMTREEFEKEPEWLQETIISIFEGGGQDYEDLFDPLRCTYRDELSNEYWEMYNKTTLLNVTSSEIDKLYLEEPKRLKSSRNIVFIIQIIAIFISAGLYVYLLSIIGKNYKTRLENENKELKKELEKCKKERSAIENK